MTTATTSFDTFLDQIRLSKELRDACQKAHTELRGKLLADADLNPVFVSMFLQGSYARHTGTKPNGTDTHVDVDLVVVTTLDPSVWTPDLVLRRFTPFLNREYPGQWEPHDRSMKISPKDSEVTLDLVVTAAPSEIHQEELFKSFRESNIPEFEIEARGDRETQSLSFREAIEKIDKAVGNTQWQRAPLLIPSRDMKTWIPTHPLEQIRWTTDKNDRTGGNYVNVVKALKWWRKKNPAGEYPKSYPLEHFIGDACPNGVGSVAEGVTRTLETIRDNYSPVQFARMVPVLMDRGVPRDVFSRITPAQYLTFYNLASTAARSARAALDAETNGESVQRWFDLFGREFPEPPAVPFTPPTQSASAKTSGRFG
jgi:Second Messenger Oligonucleotide or Dinucleotide Synthetase domain